MFRISSEPDTRVIYGELSFRAYDTTKEFDKIMLDLYTNLSKQDPRVTPHKISLDLPKKLQAKREEIENFLFEEMQVFLRTKNWSDNALKTSIHDMIEKIPDDTELYLPGIIRGLHKKFESELLLKKRTLYKNLVQYLENFPQQKIIQFSISKEGKIGSSDLKDFDLMEIRFDDHAGQWIVEKKSQNPSRYADLLQETFRIKKGCSNLSNLLGDAIKETIFHEYDLIPSMLHLTGGRDVHPITLNDAHYIASSFPYDSNRFWNFVFNQKIQVIVKLTSGKYWNDSKPPCVREERLSNNLTKRIFQITKSQQIHYVTHFDFLGWPDYGIPKKEEFDQLSEEVDKAHQMKQDSPILVHCAGGAGRTGTFIGAHTAKKIPPEKQSERTVFDMVKRMRKQRPKKMVETAEQYFFIWKIMNPALED